MTNIDPKTNVEFRQWFVDNQVKKTWQSKSIVQAQLDYLDGLSNFILDSLVQTFINRFN